MIIGDNIRELRSQERLTQDDLANLLGVTKETICRWEKGKSTIREKHLKNLLEIFGLFRDDIMSVDGGLAARAAFRTDSVGPTTEEMTSFTLRDVYKIGRTPNGTGLQLIGRTHIPINVAERHPKSILVSVKGAEMSKCFPDGSTVLVDSNFKPWNGSVVLATVDNSTTVIRKYSFGNNMVILSCHSYLSNQSDLIVDKRRIRILGTVVWYQASRDNLKN